MAWFLLWNLPALLNSFYRARISEQGAQANAY